MIEMIEANWLLLLLALIIGLVIARYVFHASRRTRITAAKEDVLSEGSTPTERNRALIDSPPAAAKVDAAPSASPASPTTPISTSPVPAPIDPAGDDLTRIKGIGPKLGALLGELGYTRFEQIANWDGAEIDRVDSHLGRFEGRIRRDNWVEQARLLASGDTAGYEGKFGKLE